MNTFPNSTIPIEPEDLIMVLSIASEADITVELTAKDEVVLGKTKTPLRCRSEVVPID
jgi:hypothetical protein